MNSDALAKAREIAARLSGIKFHNYKKIIALLLTVQGAFPVEDQNLENAKTAGEMMKTTHKLLDVSQNKVIPYLYNITMHSGCSEEKEDLCPSSRIP